MNFFRIVRSAPAKTADDTYVRWTDKLLPLLEYRDEIVELDKFTDDIGILYACRLDDDGGFTVLKDTGITVKMAHTFAGWPISSPIGKVADLDPLAPKIIESLPEEIKL